MYSLISLFIHFLLNDVTNGLYNAALYKPAVQSSTYGSYVAHLAVDGSRISNIQYGHCQHTLNDNMPWWMVDLRGQFVVDTIRLTNRMDSGFYTRLQNFSFDVFDEDPRRLPNFPNITGKVCYRQISNMLKETLNVTCSPQAIGRFLRLLMNVTIGALDICEVEVFVSDSLNDRRLFTIRLDTKLPGSGLDTLTASDPASCVQECLARRSSPCTAFIWVTTTKTCQLFSVNPSYDQTPYLVPSPGTHFYVQDNNF
ncbi:hypothetical protein Btru_041506 [Bulinus truncatus]|nr:hypothetical protein Btru_041506 [Bulinus truncatus]